MNKNESIARIGVVVMSLLTLAGCGHANNTSGGTSNTTTFNSAQKLATYNSTQQPQIQQSITSAEAKSVAQSIHSSDYRSSLNFDQLESLITIANQNNSPKIIMVGDSIVYGGGVSNGNETISHYLQQKIMSNHKNYQVYNLGLQGAAPGDVSDIVQSLKLTSKDIVIYDLNQAYFGSKPSTFPNLTGQLLKTSLKMTYSYQFVSQQLPDPEPWYTRTWKIKPNGSYRRGENVFSNNDQTLEIFEDMIKNVNSHGTKMFVFAIPLNPELMNQYNMLDSTRYASNLGRLKSIVESYKCGYENYENLIPANYFTDELHPTKQGNQILANEIYKKLL